VRSTGSMQQLGMGASMASPGAAGALLGAGADLAFAGCSALRRLLIAAPAASKQLLLQAAIIVVGVTLISGIAVSKVLVLQKVLFLGQLPGGSGGRGGD